MENNYTYVTIDIDTLRKVISEIAIDIIEKYKNSTKPHKLLFAKDVEHEYGISYKTLTYWRQSGIGPSYILIGRRVLYEREIIEQFINASKIETTGFVDE